MLEKLSMSDQHKYKLRVFVDAMQKSYKFRAVAIFGSVAKGGWNYRSDLDVLVVSDDMGDTWHERTLRAYEKSEGGVQPFVVTSQEVHTAIQERRYLIWEALYDGIFVCDDGILSEGRKRLLFAINNNIVSKRDNGWTIHVA
ncbi:MAG: nucleotidyltransferase domain-containing protein [Candidatus Thorarchaeota archaeon]|nr:nucleotidyltransferase domain-containing protein [Candidatus Thorarchaeota archaeon]